MYSCVQSLLSGFFALAFKLFPSPGRGLCECGLSLLRHLSAFGAAVTFCFLTAVAVSQLLSLFSAFSLFAVSLPRIPFPFAHSFTHAHSGIHFGTHSGTYFGTHSGTHSDAHPFVRSFTCPFVRLFVRSFTRPFALLASLLPPELRVEGASGLALTGGPGLRPDPVRRAAAFYFAAAFLTAVLRAVVFFVVFDPVVALFSAVWAAALAAGLRVVFFLGSSGWLALRAWIIA